MVPGLSWCLVSGGAWSRGEVPGPGACGPGGVPGPGGMPGLGGCLILGGAWWRPPPGTATAAGGTHPTGMHSCLHCFC